MRMTFQEGVAHWMQMCFGPEISSNKDERNHRFLEESLELVQACGCTKEDALMLVDYVYGRETGEIHQEIGGVMVTLAALCEARKFNMELYADEELFRVFSKVEQIREKQRTKPASGPLPMHVK